MPRAARRGLSAGFRRARSGDVGRPGARWARARVFLRRLAMNRKVARCRRIAVALRAGGSAHRCDSTGNRCFSAASSRSPPTGAGARTGGYLGQKKICAHDPHDGPRPILAARPIFSWEWRSAPAKGVFAARWRWSSAGCGRLTEAVPACPVGLGNRGVRGPEHDRRAVPASDGLPLGARPEIGADISVARRWPGRVRWDAAGIEFAEERFWHGPPATAVGSFRAVKIPEHRVPLTFRIQEVCEPYPDRDQGRNS